MPSEMMQCPHCATRVVPMADGICPSCRKDTRLQPTTELVDNRGERREQWKDYQESLRPSAAEESIIRLTELERPFLDIRTAAVACLKSGSISDVAVADRLRKDLLPQYMAIVDQLKQSGASGPDINCDQLIDYATTRIDSWQALVEAVAEGDQEQLGRHLELMENSDLLLLNIRGGMESSRPPSPERDVDDFQNALVAFTPRLIVTPAIVAANILIFVAMIATGVHFLEPTIESVLNWGANFRPLTLNGEWWRVVSCMFLHYGIVHLAFNMWVLWDLGRIVERLVGNTGFVLLYFLSGIAGSIASVSWSAQTVSAGASGAVFGVAGTLLGFIAFRRDTIPAPVLKHVWKSLSAFLIYNLVFGVRRQLVVRFSDN